MSDFVVNILLALLRKWWLFALCGWQQGSMLMFGYHLLIWILGDED